MPNKILKILLKPKEARSIEELLETMKYWSSLDANSREFKYAYQINNLFEASY